MKTQHLIALTIALTASLGMLPAHANTQETTVSSAQIRTLKEKAEKGDDQAQLELGKLYCRDKNYYIASEWLKKAANLNNVEAQCLLADLYYRGDGVSKDLKTASLWYRVAAEEGHARAQGMLGAMYRDGNGVTKDYKSAAKWFAEGANQGNADAQCGLGALYYNGTGVSKDYYMAVLWFRRAAEQGCAQAQVWMGVTYFEGNGNPCDHDKAAECFAKAAAQGNQQAKDWLKQMGRPVNESVIVQTPTAKPQPAATAKPATPNTPPASPTGALAKLIESAEQGNVDSQLELASAYYYGTHGAMQDYGKAVKWYAKAAAQGNDIAEVMLSSMVRAKKATQAEVDRQKQLASGKPQEKTQSSPTSDSSSVTPEQLAEWTKLAEQGDANAQYRLADLYFSGKGVTQDYGKAAEWCRKAAEQGNADAQMGLAYLYHSGEGVTQDYGKAAEWCRKSAEQGHAVAQCSLGDLYYWGQGVTQDYGKAAEWYRKSAEQGNARAQLGLGNLYYTGQGVTQDYGKAAEWYRKSAEQGDARAQRGLGVLYSTGKGVTQDYGKAAEWYRKSAEQGDADAQCSLGNLYYSGKGVTQDYGKAAEWYRKSAEQGNASAQFWLGVSYRDGKGVSQDQYKAVEYFRKAAEQGDASAQTCLGHMYYNGKGVAQDYGKAAEWYRKAAEQGSEVADEYLSTIRSLQVEERGEDKRALSIMAQAVDNHPTDNICWIYANQISRVLRRVIDDSLADGGHDTMLEKRIIEDRLERFDAVRDNIQILVDKLEARLGNEDYDIADTKKILDTARKLKERACENRTNYVSFYVAWPYLQEARRLFNASIKTWSPNDRDKIRQGVRLLTRALNKELLMQSDEKVRDYVLDLKRQLKDLVSKSEFDEFISESTLWDSNDPYKKTGADAWWSSGKGARSNSW